MEAVHYIIDTGVVDLPVRYYTADGRSVDKPAITVAASAELETPYRGDVRLEGLDRDHIHIWTSSEGMVGVTPLPKSEIWQLQATIPADIEEPEQPSPEAYQAMFDRHAGAGCVSAYGCFLAVHLPGQRP